MEKNMTKNTENSTNSTAPLGFESKLQKAACNLRGNVDASEYKGVFLGLIFLKYLSDKFEERYQELVAEGEGFEEDKDEYTAYNIYGSRLVSLFLKEEFN